MIAVKNICL
jgi:hypothetical protein